MDEAQKRLQDLSEEFQKLQSELQDNVEARQKLESQKQENQSVQKEFSKLDDEAGIYKLVGPVLMKQDRSEAVMAVNGRLEFIETEITRVEGLIKGSQDALEKKRSEVFQLQTSMQSQQQGSLAAA